MGIGNIGWTEFLVILAIALIFFGPRRLPGIAQTIGKSLREFQKALNEVKSEIAQAGREADTRAEITRLPARPSEYPPSPTIQPPTGEPGSNTPTEEENGRQDRVEHSGATPADADGPVPTQEAGSKDLVDVSGAIPTPNARRDGSANEPESSGGSPAERGEAEIEEDRGPHLPPK